MQPPVMKKSILKREIKSFIRKIDHQSGHSHLYKDFQLLIGCLDGSDQLSSEERNYLDSLIQKLLLETEIFSWRYPLWSTRCLDCAHILLRYLPESDRDREKMTKKASELLTMFVSGPLFSEFSRTEYFKEYLEDACENHVDTVWEIAAGFFRGSAEGRRPRFAEEEIRLFNLMDEGYRLAIKYLDATKDYSHFSDWFSILSPCWIASVLEQALDWTEARFHDKIVGLLQKTLDKQLSLLEKWLDGDPKGFISYWGANGIEQLLELVEDDVFYKVLRKLSAVKGHPEVEKVFAFYAEDDEPQIKAFASELLRIYND